MPTAIEFFKLLPKTNCKECGQPTCLAFAMQLANQKAKIEDCPHVSGEAKNTLNEASAPPVATVKVGEKNAINMGGETVLYRHERRFNNPIAYAVTVSDALDDEAVLKRIEYIRSLRFDRIGMVFKADMVCIRNDSKDADRFMKVCNLVKDNWDSPFVLESEDKDALIKAMDACKTFRPLVYGADKDTFDELIQAAKASKCPLAIKAGTLEDAAAMTEKAKAAGYNDIILDLQCNDIKALLEKQTAVRRAALKKKFKPFGYPMMNKVGSGEYAVMCAVISTLKYGSLVIFDDLKPYEALPLFTLRQNIYTDPQVPIQVKQGLYPINNPGEHSPIMFTTNFSLTYFTVRADIEKSKVPVWLQIVNTEGMSVLTAYSAGKFNPEHVVEAMQESGVLDKTDGKIIVPGLVARMSGKLQELVQRDVIVGTTESKNIPKHLKEITAQGQ
ncbi:MAG: acetyl-CoA decarbonylase/synthase complex subunit gamma [Candidatus Methanomethylophilaceae archaeon]|nr:acetyl-CoA decarbonylase/synthase complex subunit gamma [Candidatus Methanomethylophilaceae archaeon]